jgi:very-short-patch-repair endonuclease
MILTQSHDNHRLRVLARHLRRHGTDAERALWQLVRGKQLGVKFRRQHVVAGSPYVADFACVELMLILELDGPVHDGDQRRLDRARDQQLRRLGWAVYRFDNACILDEAACQFTLGLIRQRIKLARRRLRHEVAA